MNGDSNPYPPKSSELYDAGLDGKSRRKERRARERASQPKPGYRPNFAQVTFLALQEMRERHPGFRNIIDENGEHV